MALAWSVMDLPQFAGFAGDIVGKILVCLVIVVLSKVLSKLLGG